MSGLAIFQLTLAAGEAREAAITGNYFELRNALYPIALIELMDRSGGVISRLENPEQSDFVKCDRPYETVRITNGATAQTVKHFYGTGEAGSRRTSGLVRIDGSSDVSIIDGEKNRTLMGGMYAGAVSVTALAANFGAGQIYNPVGSGKNLIVGSSSFYGAAAPTGVYVFMNNAAMANDVTATMAGNKLSAGALGVGKLQWRHFGAVPAFAGNYLQSFFGTAYQERVWAPKGAIVVAPGYGFAFLITPANTAGGANFECFEE